MIVFMIIVLCIGIATIFYCIGNTIGITRDKKENKVGYTKCSVCDSLEWLTPENTYFVRDNKKLGLNAFTNSEEEKIYLAIDCKKCGSQIILQERKRKLEDDNYDIKA